MTRRHLLALPLPIVTSFALETSRGLAASADAARHRRQPQVIRDRNGRKLGEIRQVANGRLEARDRFGKLLGTYDPKRDETRDRLGRLLTKGNTLSALIVAASQEGRR